MGTQAVSMSLPNAAPPGRTFASSQFGSSEVSLSIGLAGKSPAASSPALEFSKRAARLGLGIHHLQQKLRKFSSRKNVESFLDSFWYRIAAVFAALRIAALSDCH